jgi:hypothetical protein
MSDSTMGPLAQRVTPGATAGDLGIHAGNWYHGASVEERTGPTAGETGGLVLPSQIQGTPFTPNMAGGLYIEDICFRPHPLPLPPPNQLRHRR